MEETHACTEHKIKKGGHNIKNLQSTEETFNKNLISATVPVGDEGGGETQDWAPSLQSWQHCKRQERQIYTDKSTENKG